MSARTLDGDDRGNRSKLLVCLGAAWPGNDASGPNRSFAAFATAFADAFDISLLARATPFGTADAAPVAADWIARETHRVRYLRVGRSGARGLLATVRETPHDVLWLNGFFDREFTIPVLLARSLRLVPRKPVILSPRGEFSGGALGLKGARKAAWLACVRATGLLHDVVVHATNDSERDDIAIADLGAKTVVVAPNLSPAIVSPGRASRIDDVTRLLFVGRISPVKNLDFALTVLASVRAPVCFDIVGPEQDATYAARCRDLAAMLPSNISVHWHGEVGADRIPDRLAKADALFLPSKSENFGHAIFEALACGTPVLIGQETPWRNLAADGAGYDLPLVQPDAFVDAIERIAASSRQERESASAAARARAARHLASSGAETRHRDMICHALGQAQC